MGDLEKILRLQDNLGFVTGIPEKFSWGYLYTGYVVQCCPDIF
jgi:hypothetical protein